MKKGILSFVSIVVLGSAFSQTIVFSDDFQNGSLSNWTISIEDSYTLDTSVSEYAAGWIITTDPEDNMDTVASSCSFFTVDGYADRWLISPAIALGSFGNFLNWNAKSADPSFPEAYKVLISNTGNALTDFDDTLMNVALENELWTNRSVNLTDSGYVDETVYIAFVLNSYNKFILYLDDVNVTINDPVGLQEQSMLAVKAYPNPTQGELFIQTTAAVQKAEVWNSYGKRIFVQQNSAPIDLSNFPTGSYWLTVTDTNGQTSQQKIIKL